MKVIRYIILSPVGCALALVHWIVVTFAFLGDIRPPEFAFGGIHSTTYLMYLLVIVDLPALTLAGYIAQFLITLFGPGIWPLNLVSVVMIITLQWMLAGAGITLLFNEYRSTEAVQNDLSLKLD